MLYIMWQESNNLGIPIIDEQHRGVVATINTFYYFIQKGMGEEGILPTLKTLRQYMLLHFHTEETLMKDVGYDHLEEHQRQHRELARKTEEIIAAAADRKRVVSALAFLKDWWLQHINVEDRKYAPLFLEKTDDG